MLQPGGSDVQFQYFIWLAHHVQLYGIPNSALNYMAFGDQVNTKKI